AIDPANTLAQEQARLVIGTLGIIAQRLPLQYRYDRDELRRGIELAGRLGERLPASGEAAAALRQLAASAAQGTEVLERARAEPAELEGAVRALRSAVGEVIQAAYPAADAAGRKTLGALVADASREQLLRERAWLSPFGFEPDPKLIPPVETLLAPVAQARS
ncbi:MAG: hypothetical protein ISP90_05890, partial [Nevskia sp.]|nr:hypothetical protein [Nevskia sp.]